MDADKQCGVGRSFVDTRLKFRRIGDARRGNINVGRARHDNLIARRVQKSLRLKRNSQGNRFFRDARRTDCARVGASVTWVKDNNSAVAAKIFRRPFVTCGRFFHVDDNARVLFLGAVSGFKVNRRVAAAHRRFEIDSYARVPFSGFVDGNFFNETFRARLNLNAGDATDSAGQGVVQVKLHARRRKFGGNVACVESPVTIGNFNPHGLPVQVVGVYAGEFGGFGLSRRRQR